MIQQLIALLGLCVAVIALLATLFEKKMFQRSKLFLSLMLLIVSGFAVVLAFQWQEARTSVMNEQRIKDVILKGTKLELAWYKSPQQDMLSQLEQYFSPVEKGGDRLGQIVSTVDQLREDNQRQDVNASRALIINKLSVALDGTTALVETAEIWYQPKVESNTGESINQTAEKLNLYTPVQLYVLRKLAGRWYIESNPAPVAPRSPSIAPPATP